MGEQNGKYGHANDGSNTGSQNQGGPRENWAVVLGGWFMRICDHFYLDSVGGLSFALGLFLIGLGPYLSGIKDPRRNWFYMLGIWILLGSVLYMVFKYEISKRMIAISAGEPIPAPANAPLPANAPPVSRWLKIEMRPTRASVIGGPFRVILDLDANGDAPPTIFPISAGDPKALVLQARNGLVWVDAKLSDGISVVTLQKDNQNNRKLLLLNAPPDWDVNGDENALEVSVFDKVQKDFWPVFQIERIDDANIKVRGVLAGSNGMCQILMGNGRTMFLKNFQDIRVGRSAMLKLFEYPSSFRDPTSKLDGVRFKWPEDALRLFREFEQKGAVMDAIVDPSTTQPIFSSDIEGLTIQIAAPPPPSTAPATKPANAPTTLPATGKPPLPPPSAPK
jgi:hypothetical protein